MHYKQRAHKSRRMAIFFNILHTFGKCNTPKRQPEQDGIKCNVRSNQGGNLKSLLFKDCHDSRTEFINLHMNGHPSGVGEKRR